MLGFFILFFSPLYEILVYSLRASGKDNITIVGHSWANCSTGCFEGSSTVKQQSGKTQLIFIEMVVHWDSLGKQDMHCIILLCFPRIFKSTLLGPCNALGKGSRQLTKTREQKKKRIRKTSEHLPTNVPIKKYDNGTPITGEQILINQLGRNGVIRKKMM